MVNKKLLIIGYVWPEPKSSAAGKRMLQLIEVFLSDNYNVVFASPCAKTDHAFNLNTIGVTQETIILNSSSFDTFVKALQPDVVMFDRFMMEEQFGWRVAEQCPNALRILDTEDLHFLRKGRHQALKDKNEFNAFYLYNDIAKREIASIYRCDLSLIISKYEIEILKHDFKVDASLLVYLPFMIDKIKDAAFNKLPNYKARKDFITIGNFLHAPNYNAVLYLKDTIWPLIRKELPEAQLHIYGAYVSEKVQQLHNKAQGFLIQGFAEDVHQLMQHAKVCLAPVRFGAGLKGKLVDALQNGTPSITTTIGAEGMIALINACGYIADTPEAFAKKAVRLYTNTSLWNEKSMNTYQVINQHFNKEVHESSFIEAIENCIASLDEKRQHNFIGQMLRHHTLQSTKYMSKWIEEKHK